jgi:PAS domain S-box-containing protein
MTITSSKQQAIELIDTLNEMASGRIPLGGLEEIVAAAKLLEGAGQHIQACNVLGMVSALRGDPFEVERSFKAAIQHGGNDEWTLGNYATALNHLVGIIQKNTHHEPLLSGRVEPESHPPKFAGAAPSNINDIAGHKSMEEVSSATLDLDFRSLAENLPDNVVRWDRQGRYVYINPALERTLATPDVIGKTKSEAFPDGRFALVEKTIAQVVATGKMVRLLRQLVPAKNGEMRFHDLILVPEFDETGQVISVLGIGRDMTDIYRMQEAIAAREQEFRSLAESSPDFIARYDRDGCHRYLNSPLVNWLGLSSVGEVIGLRGSEVWPDGRFDKIAQAAEQAIESGSTQVIELTVPNKTDGFEYHQICVVPERDVSGAIIGTIVFGRNITSIRESEEQLRLKEFALDQAHEAVYLMDARGAGFLYVNEATCRSLGYSREELLGLSLPDIDPYISPEELQAIEDRLMTEGAVTVESRHRRSDGSSFPVEIRTSAFQYQGRMLGMALVRNITERKQAEQALEELHSQLRGLITQRETAREEERKLIARDVHDELGQILTGLKMKIAVIELLFAPDVEPLREHVKEAMSLMENAIGTVRNISTALRPVAMDLDVVTALEWQAARFKTFTNVQCNVCVGDIGAPPDENIAVVIFRIVQESLTNIARHAEANHVEISLQREADGYVLKISDDGKGFDISVRKSNSFGLVGIRERALMLGGELAINSGMGQGSEIVVRIPVGSSIVD